MRFIVPVKNEEATSCVRRCVASIREHHPNDPITVVDSDSPDKSYMGDLDAEVWDIHNQGFGHAAWKWAYQRYDDEFFALIFDSLLVHANLAHLEEQPVTATRHFLVPPNNWGITAEGVPLNQWAEQWVDFELPAEFVGIQGPMMFAHRSVLDELGTLGFWDIRITSRFEHEGLERLAGIMLARLGYDMTRSLQGEMHGYWDTYDTTFVEKLNLARD